MTLPAPLLLITDRTQNPRPVVDTVAAALEGGCRWVMLREKDLPPEALLAMAWELAALAKRHHAVLSVNSDLEAAKAVGAGLHLPAGRDIAAARNALGSTSLIGASAHSLAEAQAAEAAGADYVTLSPLFATASKPGYGPALGLDGLRHAVAALRLPVVALAGIDASNAADCLAAGAAGIAVMGGVMRADDPEAEIAGLIAALQTA
ncbi:MAG: thiamine phosphate synthase [Alphaproteobacteria bacterium]|nr:thiamine phosphate synthase [Alphaproteobacteria bacterium]MBU0796391.1 thiamine phosphate synthase [Alphaproteobacteria bacterium]MBU0886742.1 thiamine phosphate synthase [Alphaproteobacteria bacterium]MBU1812645.1 thiamine phosphate synthase [Alphaproteobacteria bacterium]MBU2090905.1 thiamine phosphate synthase [Alphaproteobacteria bacterium]